MRLPGGRWVALAGAGALALGMLAGVSSPASARTAPAFAPGLAAAATPFNEAEFKSVGTGSELFANLLTSGNTTVAGVRQAFAAQSVNSTGLVNNATNAAKTATFDSESGALIQPSSVTTASSFAQARGSGIELGLGTDKTSTTNPNQLVFPTSAKTGKFVEASSPPTPSQDSGSLVSLPSSLAAAATAGVLNAAATTHFNSSFCPLGNHISYGEGDLATAGLLQNGKKYVVDTQGTAGTAAVAQTTSFTDLTPNSDGTFGIMSEAHQTIVPLTLNLGSGNLITLTIQGSSPDAPLTLQAKAPGESGQGGGTTVTGDETIVIQATSGGTPQTPIKVPLLQMLPKTTSLGPLGSIDIDTLKPMTGSNKSTFEGATFDLFAIHLTGIGDIGLGHMQVMAAAATPIECTIPVTKTSNPPSVQAGNQFTWNISIPTSKDALGDTSCNLVNINVTDKFGVFQGNPKFTFVSASNGGKFNGTDTVTWTALGPYHPGDPPIMLSIIMNVPADSPAGIIQDTVDVVAQLGGCQGSGGAQTSTGANAINGKSISGHFRLNQPTVMAGVVPAQLPRTGGGGPILPWVGGGLLVLAEATRRLIRRARRASATS